MRRHFTWQKSGFGGKCRPHLHGILEMPRRRQQIPRSCRYIFVPDLTVSISRNIMKRRTFVASAVYVNTTGHNAESRRMVKAVSCPFPSAKIQFQGTSCGICGK
jgi:hypothetical protein